jgi:hypothetical protein
MDVIVPVLIAIEMPPGPEPQLARKRKAAQIKLSAAVVRSNAARPVEFALTNRLDFGEVFLMQAYAFKIVIAPLVFFSGSAQAGVEYSLVEPLARAAKPFE